jgi:predicted nucleic acid-binding protein
VSFLLDTNVVSEIRKKTPDTGVTSWFASVPADQLFLSVLVVGEIRQGIERLVRRDPTQAEIFELSLSLSLSWSRSTKTGSSPSPPMSPRRGAVSTSLIPSRWLMA